MSREPDGLAQLLPQWHRLRDTDEGEPLRALLAVMAEQIDVVRNGVEQSYEDLFVETAAPWVLPYLGDLVGYRTLPGYERVLTNGLRGGSSAALTEAIAPRRDVAATVANLRRKGTLHLLEELCEQVAEWPSRAVELSRLVSHQQPVKLYGSGSAGRERRGRLADLRDGSALDLAGSAFGTVARSVDVRSANSHRRQGGSTPAGVGLFVWRLKAHSLTSSPRTASTGPATSTPSRSSATTAHWSPSRSRSRRRRTSPRSTTSRRSSGAANSTTGSPTTTDPARVSSSAATARTSRCRRRTSWWPTCRTGATDRGAGRSRSIRSWGGSRSGHGRRPGRASGWTTTTRSAPTWAAASTRGTARRARTPRSTGSVPGRRTGRSWTRTGPGSTTGGPGPAGPRASSRSPTAARTRSSWTSIWTPAIASKYVRRRAPAR